MTLRSQRKDQHRAFRRVDFAVGGSSRHTGGQQSLRQIEGGLHIARRAIDVALQIKLQADAGTALG